MFKSSIACSNHNIAFLCLYPNATHLLQPPDVAWFALSSGDDSAIDDNMPADVIAIDNIDIGDFAVVKYIC